MAKEFFTDEQVEVEILRLLNSEDVKLANLESRIRNKRRQYMYNLRAREKRGKALKKMGYTLENLGSTVFGQPEDEVGED